MAPDLGKESVFRAQLEGLGCIVHNMPLRRTGVNPVFDLATLLRMLVTMAKIRPTHVLTYNIKPVIYGSIAAFIMRIPRRYALITGIGFSLSSERVGGIFSILIKTLYSFALKRVTLVFFQNSDDMDLFSNLGIINGEVDKKIVNGSGIDLDYFAPVKLTTAPVTFLMIARLLTSKGINEYVEACRLLKGKYPEVQFQLVGWIDENPEAISLATLNNWVVKGDIEYLGKLEDVRPAIANANVYVLPSYREGTPRTVLEAMAMGRPIVTTDAPGCRETVVDGVNGFLVRPKNTADLVMVMERFIQEPDIILKMGDNSLKIAREKYDVNKVNEVMLHSMGL